MITYTINKDLNVRPETTRLLEENTGGKFLDIGHDKRFLDLAPGEKQTTTKAGKNSQLFVCAFINNVHKNGRSCAGVRHSAKRTQH